MPSTLEPDIAWFFMVAGIVFLTVDLLLGFFTYKILRRRLRKEILKEAKEIEKQSGTQIIQARMRALKKEFKTRVKEEINQAKTEEVLDWQRKTLKKLMR
ncbi:MAG: hypothetical protein ACLP3B_07740 [Syntrophobacteraceae bacterium]